jgi:hypothetical protein
MKNKRLSRKGARRQRGISTARQNDRADFHHSDPDEAPIKLDPSTNGINKAIARIESPLLMEVASLPRRAKNTELTWGQKPAHHDYRWLWMTISATFVLLFGSIALVNYQSNSEAAESIKRRGGIEVVVEEMESRSPLFAFEKDPYEVRLQCINIFHKFTAARTASEVRYLIRDQPETDALLARHWKPWPSPPQLDYADLLESNYDDAQGRGFLWLKGKNLDGSPFLAFFVATENSFLLDWEATMALGETRLSHLVRDPASEPMALRVILSSSNFYLPTLPESEYESYQIYCPKDDTIVWGYVKRDTLDHKRINELLQKNALLLDEVTEVRITLRLLKTNDTSPQNRFFITEMLHKDWVMP